MERSVFIWNVIRTESVTVSLVRVIVYSLILLLLQDPESADPLLQVSFKQYVGRPRFVAVAL